MSTFGGFIPEFPNIRVDCFRQILGPSAPLACFLSHVHSDHLDGLDNDRVKLPFVYCSAATKEILVRLEKRRDRLNLAKGILEKEKRTYKHLKSVLKPIPLETPTLIELAPRNEVRVTLFDANHCTGAVMFLFERENTAVLYTGDVRSEPWFVNNLTRNPFLIEYTSGMKTLDCIYLDTSNTEPTSFPTKAEGLKELIGKVRKYPPNTKFHFSAWTFGYEEVWAALSRTLDSQIHVDKYKLKLYKSLRQEGSDGQLRFLAPEGPVLAGCVIGNGPREGCLTTDKSVRIHSCEKGMGCSAYEDEDIVLIRPIITRLPSGVEVAEVGIGGGWGDLVPSHELAMCPEDIKELLETLFAETEEPILNDIRKMLLAELESTKEAISLDGMPSGCDQISLKDLGESLLRKLARKSSEIPDEKRDSALQNNGLPKLITFPYSRHSSYTELRHLVEIFKPKDVYPCTVDEENWDDDVSMKTLFGYHCSASIFRHDREMRHLMAFRGDQVAISSQQTQETAASRPSPMPTGQFDEFNMEAARWTNNSSPSTPTPSQRNIAGTSQNPFSSCSEVIITSPLAPPSVKNAAGIIETPESEATDLGSSSSSQTSRRRMATELISPPPLKRVRISEDLQIDSATSTKNFEFSTFAGGLKQQSLESVGEPSKGKLDFISALKIFVEFLGDVPALCDQAIIALKALDDGDIGAETYINRELPLLKSIKLQIDHLSPPPVLSELHMTMRTLSQEALDTLLNFQSILDLDAAVETDVDLYFNMQLSPLKFLDTEFKQAISYSKQAHPSQYRPWKPVRSFHSMAEFLQPEANSDTGIITHTDRLTLVKDNQPIDNTNDNDIDSSDNVASSLIADGGGRVDFDQSPFHDPIDDILRCGDCGHEIWVEHWQYDHSTGFCTGCDRGPTPFCEYADFPGAFPRIYEDDECRSEAESEEARDLTGNTHLDYQSSAYDTQDEDSQLNEEYEIDSFIDDDEVASDSESDTSNGGSEIDYKAELEKLQEEHAALRADYFDLVDEYCQFRYDVLGTSEEEDEDLDGDGDDEGVLIDEEGAHVVDVVVARGDHVVTDLVLSSFVGGEGDGNGDLGDTEGEDVDDVDDEGAEFEDEVEGEEFDGTTIISRSSTLSKFR